MIFFYLVIHKEKKPPVKFMDMNGEEKRDIQVA